MEKGKKIVVYGCDNTGKTTLCKNLSKIFNSSEGLSGRTLWVKSLGPGKTLSEYINFMIGFLNSHDNIIFERYPLFEESIYGNLLRGRNVFEDLKENDKYDELLTGVDVFIHCFPGFDSLLNFGQREQMGGVKENVMQIVTEFKRLTNFLKENDFPVIEYNYNLYNVGFSFDVFVQGIMEKIERGKK